MFFKPILPVNANVELVGGEGKEFWASGRNWPLPGGENWRNAYRFTGNWRIETSDPEESDTTIFLNVLQAADTNTDAMVSVDAVAAIGNKGPGVVITSKDKTVWTVTFNDDGTDGGWITAKTKDGEVLVDREFTREMDP